MARTPREASTPEVRKWAQETGWTDPATGQGVSDRGRMPSSLAQAFNKANKRHNIVYMNGGRIVGEQQPAAQAKASTPTPRQPSANDASNGSGTTRRSRSTDSGEAASAPSMVTVTDPTTEAIQSLITGLASAGNGKKNGTPIVLTAHALVYA